MLASAQSIRSSALVALLVAASCSGVTVQPGPNDTGLDGLAFTGLDPKMVLPGARVDLTGSSFVDKAFGETVLRLKGTFKGEPFETTVPLTFDDYDKMHFEWRGGPDMGFP